MKKIFVSLTAIFITASFVSGQADSKNLSKQTNGSDRDALVTNNKGDNIKLKTLFIENSNAGQNSSVLARAIVLNNQGIRLIQKKDYQNALALFEQADSLAPRSEQILFNLGTALLNLKRNGEAAEAFAKIIEIAPTNANAYGSLGLALNNVGKIQESFALFRRSLEISPEDAVTLCNFANALHHAGNEVEALAIVQQAIKLPAGNFSAAYNIRGIIFFNLKKYGEAKTDFELAARLDPKSADPINNLGVVFSREGKKKKALRYFLEAERLAPDWDDVAYNLALNFSQIGNRAKSDEYLLKLEHSNSAIAEELKKTLLRKYVLDVSKIK